MADAKKDAKINLAKPSDLQRDALGRQHVLCFIFDVWAQKTFSSLRSCVFASCLRFWRMSTGLSLVRKLCFAGFLALNCAVVQESYSQSFLNKPLQASISTSLDLATGSGSRVCRNNSFSKNGEAIHGPKRRILGGGGDTYRSRACGPALSESVPLPCAFGKCPLNHGPSVAVL